MKALSVLLVLVLSTPCYAECLDTKILSQILFEKHYIISRRTPPNIIELIDLQHLHWVDIYVSGNVSCVMGEGEYT